MCLRHFIPERFFRVQAAVGAGSGYDTNANDSLEN